MKQILFNKKKSIIFIDMCFIFRYTEFRKTNKNQIIYQIMEYKINSKFMHEYT